MNLKRLIDGSVPSDFILLHDNKDAKGETLLSEFGKQNVKLGNKVDLVCIEKNSHLLKNFPVASNCNHHFINDCLLWFKKDNKDSGNNIWNLLQGLQNQSKSHSKSVIVIDSLSLLLLLYPETCYREIHKFIKCMKSGKTQSQLICLLHTDIIRSNKKITLMFERLASTNVYLEQLNKKAQVTIKHRKASGRVIEVVEKFCFDQSLNLVAEEVINVKETHAEDDKDWLTKDLTFKLDLKDKEKQARSELVLPYLKTSKEGGSGEIFYEPDTTDDWDEEDPDDDLDI